MQWAGFWLGLVLKLVWLGVSGRWFARRVVVWWVCLVLWISGCLVGFCLVVDVFWWVCCFGWSCVAGGWFVGLVVGLRCWFGC